MGVAVLFAVLTMLAWSVGDVFGAVSARKTNVYHTAFWLVVAPLAVSTAYLPFAWGRIADYTLEVALLNVVLGAMLTACYLAFLYALKIGNPTLVGTISGSYVALVVLFSTWFLQERLDGSQTVAIAAIFVGLLLTNLNTSLLKRKRDKHTLSLILTMFVVIGWGVYFTFIKIPVDRVGWFLPNYVTYIAEAVVLLIFVATRENSILRPRFFGRDKQLGLAILISGGAMFWMNIALEHGNASVVGPIAGSYPVFFALLSHYVFKDSVTMQQKTGMVITLAGIVGLSIVS